MSQSSVLLAHLLAGNTVTPALAYALAGSLACHSRMAELRAAGHNIQKRMVTCNGKRYGEYSLRGQLDMLATIQNSS